MKLAIIHFNPIELYPPVMNLLNHLSNPENPALEIMLFTRNPPSGMVKFGSTASSIKIIRSGNSKKQHALYRYLNYSKFYFYTLKQLVGWKPDKILYYETLSSFPAIIYKKIIRSRCSMLVHYHEYTSPDEYRNEMILNRWGHLLEKKTYPLYKWVSHTNQERMHFFLKENTNVSGQSIHIMPNYPPYSWERVKNKSQSGSPIKFVYTGALSLDTMYTKEFADWIIQHEGQMTWDIYSTNVTDDAKIYLSSLNSVHIQFRGGVNYFSLPDILEQYNIGVILYKGHIPNYIYNAPNKLFEYWACGLDVWFPQKMSSSLSFATKGHYPKIVPVNFDELSQLDIESTISHSGHSYKPSPYYCEQVFDSLLKKGIEIK